MRIYASIAFLSVFFSIINGTSKAAVIWNGPNLTFTKVNLADWTLPQNQDRLTGDVWITRKDNQGIFNIKQELGYVHNVSPAGTEWAYGSAANWPSLAFTNWEAWAFPPPDTVGKNAVLHLIADNIYIDIKFLSWSSTAIGGGFSYVRSTPTPAAIDWQGGTVSAPADWGTAANWNPSTLVPNGPGAVASFGNEAATDHVVDMVSAGRTVGSMIFNTTTETTIQSTGGFALTLDNGGNYSRLDVAGNHIISAPVILNNDATISGSGTLNISGGISGAHTLKVLGNLTASNINVDSLTIGGTGAAQAVPEPASLIMLVTIALCGFIWIKGE